MNIFLSQNTITDSVKDLDDLRLQKQLVEVYQLLTLAIKEQQEGHEIKAGHYHHPVYLYYKRNIPFLIGYGYECCKEYKYRFGKEHKLYMYFSCRERYLCSVTYIPFYMEGSKGQPNYIRTCDNVYALFQAKLCKKWDADKLKGREPRWTNRDVPEFYKKYLEGKND